MSDTPGSRSIASSLRVVATSVIAVGGALCPAHAQPLVRVRAETRIELAVTREDPEIAVTGALRDDLGAPLIDQPLRIEVRRDAPTGALHSTERVSTGAGGAFAARFELPLGRWFLIATFEGDEHYQAQEVPREARLDRAHVRLDVSLEGGARIDLDRPRHAMLVRASSEAGGAGLDVTVLENGRVLGHGLTDERGEVRFALASTELGVPSATRLVVRSESDARRGDAQTEVPVVRFRATQLEAQASSTEVRVDEPLRVSGTLRTSAGPLPRRAIGLWSGDTHLGTALTDAEGAFAISIAYEDLVELPGPIVARFESDAPWWGSCAAAPIEISMLDVGTLPWPWLAASALVSASLFALAGRRKRPPSTGRAEMPAAAPAIEFGARRSLLADSPSIHGTVVDARTERPIVGAVVHVRRGDVSVATASTDLRGAFSVEPSSGPFVLEIEAQGYATVRQRGAIPHRGEWSAIVLRMRSLRELAWEPLRPIAIRLLPSPDLWGVWTGRDLETAARSRARSARTLSSLIESIERACYATAPPTDEDLQAIRRKAAEVEREMDAALGPAPLGGERVPIRR